MALQSQNWTKTLCSSLNHTWGPRTFLDHLSSPNLAQPSSSIFLLLWKHLNFQKWTEYKNELFFNHQRPTICVQSCLMYTYVHPLSRVLYTWRKSQAFYHFIHKYFSMWFLQVKIHTLLLKISKPASFLCSGLSINSSEDEKKNSKSVPLFWRGGCFFSSHLLFHMQGQNLIEGDTLAILGLCWWLALHCLENPTQRFALETPHLPHRVGYKVK